MAVNCCCCPLAIDGLAGVTAIDTSVARHGQAVEPLMEPDVAVMVVVPTATAVARPVPLMVAIEVAPRSR